MHFYPATLPFLSHAPLLALSAFSAVLLDPPSAALSGTEIRPPFLLLHWLVPLKWLSPCQSSTAGAPSERLEVLPGKPVKVALPLRTTGQAIGVMNGGRLELNYRRVPVRGIADQLPECLTVDITPLKIGDNARVRDLNVEGLEILLSESALLVACKRTRAAMSAESALEGEEGGEGAEGGEGEGEGGEE